VYLFRNSATGTQTRLSWFHHTTGWDVLTTRTTHLRSLLRRGPQKAGISSIAPIRLEKKYSRTQHFPNLWFAIFCG
jgi:hypothetical protein